MTAYDLSSRIHHLLDLPAAVRRRAHVGVLHTILPRVLVVTSIALWTAIFAGLALTRHAAGGSHAEDLGVADQVIRNFLRGEWFKMTLFQGGFWNTEVDVLRFTQPDSLLAFHAEPMLLAFVPFYALGADTQFLLIVQAFAFALGAIPAYRLGARWGRSSWLGLVVALIYLLSPYGQWAILSDFHTSVLAAPLLLLAVERLAAGYPRAAILASAAAITAREDVAVVVMMLGVMAWLWGQRRTGLIIAGMGIAASILMFLWMQPYNGGGSAFSDRFAVLAGGPVAMFQALTRPVVLEYFGTILLSGGWLALLAPIELIAALPVLVANAFSASPWMAAGKGHYSALLLPFLTVGVASGLGQVRRLAAEFIVARRNGQDSTPSIEAAVAATDGVEAKLPDFAKDALRTGKQLVRLLSYPAWAEETKLEGQGLAIAVPGISEAGERRLVRLTRWFLYATGGLLALTAVGIYLHQGSGPLGANYNPAQVTEHSQLALQFAARVPEDASVSASPSLIPHLTQRERVYIFPAVEDAEYLLLDLSASPAPTSGGDIFLRVQVLLAGGEWAIIDAKDGLLLLKKLAPEDRGGPIQPPVEFFSFVRPLPGTDPVDENAPPLATLLDGGLELLAAEVMPSPVGTVEPDGPRGLLRTYWRATRPLPEGIRPEIWFTRKNGEQVRSWDLSAFWWYPLNRWMPGEIIRVDVPGVPIRDLDTWRPAIPSSDYQHFDLGELTLEVESIPWRMRLLDPEGQIVWEEAPDHPLGYYLSDGTRVRATRLVGMTPRPGGGYRLVAATDDPADRWMIVEVRPQGDRRFRLTASVSEADNIVRFTGGFVAQPDEHFVGFGERFTGIDQRGQTLDFWVEDRGDTGKGESTHAPVPVLLSSAGHGFAIEGYERARLDLAATQPDRWTWEQEAAVANVIISHGSSLKELLYEHAQQTGFAPLPPIWAFGVWKHVVGGQESVLDEARLLRELDIPFSALYVSDAIDRAANIGWPSVGFAGRQTGPYSDLAELTSSLKQLGYKALAYFGGDFKADSPLWEEAGERGLLVKQQNGQPYFYDRFGVLWLDFTNPGAGDWWTGVWRRALVDLGFDGGMLDGGEYLPADAVLSDGTTGRESHNRWPLLHQQRAWEAASAVRPDGDWVLFARSGALGAQRYQSLQWPGNPRMQWDGAWGFQGMIPAALSSGLSGFPFWHPEVAGHVQAGLTHEQERELWLRWLQFATWTATVRDQYGNHPNNPVDLYLDEELTAAFRDAAKVHNSLVPYLYSAAKEATETGLPLMRYMAIEYPDDPRAWEEEQAYFLGSSILVAPVVEPGATERTVYLPAGGWVDVWTGYYYEGGQEVTVPAPLDGGRAPAFIRAGELLPLAPEFDTLAPAEAEGVTTYQGDLIVRIAPGGTGYATFTLYDGTRLEWDNQSLRVTENAQPRTIEVRAPGREPVQVKVDGRDAVIPVP